MTRHASGGTVLIPAPALSLLQRSVHGQGQAFASACERMRHDIDRAALALAAGNARLAAMLAERGREVLWAIDVSRYGDEDELELRAAVIGGMTVGNLQPSVP